jgi:hypothetical protein
MSETYIKTGKPEFDEFLPVIKSFFDANAVEVYIDAKKISAFIDPDAPSFWIRTIADHLRASKYFADMRSAIEHFAETQADNGRIFDYFTVFPEKLPCEKENWTKYVRVPVEADVEFRFIKAIYLMWQACGDDDWVKKLMPKMEKALNYILTNPWRWDKKLKLVKRAYTIDTWDFAYTAGKHSWLQFQIDENTFWGIMHGDNSGYYEAFMIMSFFYELFKNKRKSEEWKRRALDLKRRMNKICWNGKFYTHFVKITPVVIEGVDESQQLSLSNPMDINRGVTTHKMAVSIIKEYLDRKAKTSAFAEWFSIDPPFPDGIFGDERIIRGAYCNGGIMPLVGGELAKAAFDHGFEWYGVDILKRYYDLAIKTRKTYLWYFPDGTPLSQDKMTSPMESSTDIWGSSAMFYAMMEGLAGVEDKFKLFRKVKLSPRWISAGVDKAQVNAFYKVSGCGIFYDFNYDGEKIVFEISSQNSTVDVNVLLPEGAKARKVLWNGKEIDFKNSKVEKSNYASFSVNVKNYGKAQIFLK